MQVMKRWLDAGVDGFRLDAIPIFCEREGTNNENLPETHIVTKRLRAELDAYAKGEVRLRKPINGRKTCRNISATATNAIAIRN